MTIRRFVIGGPRGLATGIACSALVLAACGGTDSSEDQGAATETSQKIQERTLRFQTTSAPDDPWQQALEMFGELVEDRSEGKINIDVFCCGELVANSVQEAESIASGDLDGSFIPLAVLTGFNEKAAAFMLPFIAPDAESYHRLLDSDAGSRVFEEVLQPMGIHPITGATSNQGFRQLTNSVRPVTSPEDMEGLTIRTSPAPMWQEYIAELGGDFVQMPFSDLPGALQQGTVDGQENPLNLISAAGMSDFQNHLTVWNYAGSPLVFGVNQDMWDGLEPAAQDILEQAAIDAATWHRDEYQAIDARLVDELEDEFESVVVLTEEQAEPFKTAAQAIYDDWADRLDQELIEEFRAIAAAG